MPGDLDPGSRRWRGSPGMTAAIAITTTPHPFRAQREPGSMYPCLAFFLMPGDLDPGSRRWRGSPGTTAEIAITTTPHPFHLTVAQVSTFCQTTRARSAVIRRRRPNGRQTAARVARACAHAAGVSAHESVVSHPDGGRRAGKTLSQPRGGQPV